MKRIFMIMTLISLSIPLQVFGDEVDLETKLNALKLERLQAEVMIKNMESSGRLSSEQAHEARREISNAHYENIEKLKTEALEKIQNKRSVSSSSF